MSYNCYHEKLNVDFQNENLPVFRMLKAKMKLNSDNTLPRLAFIASDGPIEVTLFDSNVSFTTAVSPSVVLDSKHAVLYSDYGKSVYVTGASTEDWINVGISDKYNLEKIGATADDFDLGGLSYSFGLKEIRPNTNGTFYGNLESLAECVELELLRLASNQKKVKGNISSLGKLTNLTTIGLAALEGIDGSWDDFIAAQKTNGRSICSSLTIELAYSTLIPFGSKPNTAAGGAGEPAILKWDSTKISLQWDTSKIVWTIGYTQGEAESAFPTYTVVLCDPT